MKFLVEAGAHVNTNQNHVAPILYVSAEHGHKKIVEYLVGKDADLESEFNGYTSLYAACMKASRPFYYRTLALTGMDG